MHDGWSRKCSVSEYAHGELGTTLERHYHSYKDIKTSDIYKVALLFRSMLETFPA